MLVSIRPVFNFCFTKAISPSCHSFKVCNFSVSVRSLSSRLYRPPAKHRKWKPTEVNESEETETSNDEELDILLRKTLKLPGSGHQVFVIQPYIKWGYKKKRNTTPQLQLQEAVTLIKTLREWIVVDEAIISLQSIHMNSVFGTGVLRNLKERIRQNPKVSAVFISLDTLTFQQQICLEEIFCIPVFDRYSIIMCILKEHAQTKEAKLQIQLAQLPYVWTVLRGINSGMDEKFGISANLFGGCGPKLFSNRKEAFKAREAKIRKEILDLREQRTYFRSKREKSEIPVVAVVGYTNAGKTSLIKALTGKKTLEPQDYLFATLDVSSHLGILPSGLTAFFVDTLGFISDIPVYLIESFTATLEDTAFAKVIIHVRDISHPDSVAQNDVVNKTLNSLNIPEVTMNNVITVGNKIDLIEKKDLEKYKDLICVSSTNLNGIDFLRQEIEKKILQLSNKIHIVIRVQSGSSEYNWLHESSTIVKEIPDVKNNQFMLLETIISPSCLAKFKHKFIKNYKKLSPV